MVTSRTELVELISSLWKWKTWNSAAAPPGPLPAACCRPDTTRCRDDLVTIATDGVSVQRHVIDAEADSAPGAFDDDVGTFSVWTKAPALTSFGDDEVVLLGQVTGTDFE